MQSRFKSSIYRRKSTDATAHSFLKVLKRGTESFFQQGYLADEIGDGVGEGFLRTVVRCRLDPQHKLGLQGMRDLVASKQHLRVFQQLRSQCIAKGVIFFVNSEHSSVRNFGVFFDRHLFFVKQQKWLERWRRIHDLLNVNSRGLETKFKIKL